MKYFYSLIGSFVLVVAVYLLGVQFNWYGNLEHAGDSVADVYPRNLVEEKSAAQENFMPGAKQILFGDTHVHTSYSTDAFLWSLPILNGEGPHPISDACDYARFCSALDFWVTTDHAEASTPRKWQEIKEAVRQCNAPADEKDPDMVTFLGFEWTQVGTQANDHFGHKNVMFLDIEEGKAPKRPIGAGGLATVGMRQTLGSNAEQFKPLAVLDFKNRHRYFNFIEFGKELSGVPYCEEGVSSALLPADCYESAETPQDLYAKLNELDIPTIVIPHGNTWGFYSPPNISWDKQLTKDFNDENLQIIIEVMSGHGNSEEYRPWRAVMENDDGSLSCPEPTKDYLPSCWKAGEIIAKRCLAEGIDSLECAIREEEARSNFANMGAGGFHSVPGVKIEDWLDSGQCKDCFIPSFNYRPGGSAQYALAISNFDEEKVKRFNFGFIASSDNHRARPGTGYKEIDRFVTTEANGATNPDISELLFPMEEPSSEPIFIGIGDLQSQRRGFDIFEAERQASFFTTGGLAAVHSSGRDRQSIWDGMRRKETYGTSGDRILLWFDLLHEDGIIPMGGEVAQSANPTFSVKALGAFEQKPGCPDYSSTQLSQEDIMSICKNECYNPSDVRKKISRIEVIKITPQMYSGEDVNNLIQDVWKSFECPMNGEGCSITFTDESFESSERDTSYYVRAVQEPSTVINANNLRCTYNESGECEKVNICHGDFKTAREDDCLSTSEEKAWSSPIFVDYDAKRSDLAALIK